MELKLTGMVNHLNLHRTAKYFMDIGRANSPSAALDILRSFGLSIRISGNAALTYNGQLALLTLVNLARRTMLAGVEVFNLPDVPVTVRLTEAQTLHAAVKELGGKIVSQPRIGWPTALIGDTGSSDRRASPSWQLTWEGWRGGVTPAKQERRLSEEGTIPLAPVMAAAACTGEVFAFHAGDHTMAGHRSSGLSLWQPGVDWLKPDPSEPDLAFLPSRLWLIGLGNLGHAYAWLLACLPFNKPEELELMLQDFDVMTVSSDSTSVLASMTAVGWKKTRWVSTWLEGRGFSTSIEERRFGEWTRRTPDEPGVALCGVDNAHTRASLERAGFDLIIEAGLGAGPQGFRSFSMHSFPGSRAADRLWSKDVKNVATDITEMPAYKKLRDDGMDDCGLVQMATRTVGVPFVGLIAGGVVIAELLRRLHGAPGIDLVSGSVGCLKDIESVTGNLETYAHGYVSFSG